MGFGKVPAVDVVDTEKAYEVTAELPGMDEKNVEVKLANGVLTIKGEEGGDLANFLQALGEPPLKASCAASPFLPSSVG